MEICFSLGRCYIGGVVLDVEMGIVSEWHMELHQKGKVRIKNDIFLKLGLAHHRLWNHERMEFQVVEQLASRMVDRRLRW